MLFSLLFISLHAIIDYMFHFHAAVIFAISLRVMPMPLILLAITDTHYFRRHADIFATLTIDADFFRHAAAAVFLRYAAFAATLDFRYTLRFAITPLLY